MAASPAFVATLRAALRLAIGSALAIAMVYWCGRGDRVFLSVIAVVLYVSENRFLPWTALLQQFAAGVVAILTALVLFQVADGWLMLSLVLLVVSLLLELLRLQSSRGLALLLAWAVLVMDAKHTFNIATVFDLALAFVIGLLAARFAVALVWPQRPGSPAVALDQGLRTRLLDQVCRVQQWLAHGGPPPAPLAAAELLPKVLELQHQHSRQLGLLWRLIVRHWLLLEPQLLGLHAPLAHPAAQLLQQRLDSIQVALSPATDATDAAGAAGPLLRQPAAWRIDLASELIALAIEQQLNTLDQLLHSRRLLRGSGRLLRQSS